MSQLQPRTELTQRVPIIFLKGRTVEQGLRQGTMEPVMSVERM